MAKPKLDPAAVQAALEEIRAKRAATTSTTPTGKKPLNPADIQNALNSIKAKRAVPTSQTNNAVPTQGSKEVSLLERVLKGINGAKEFSKDLNIGLFKGAGTTALGMGQLGQKALQTVTGIKPVGGQEQFNSALAGVKSQYLTPKNTAQNIGYGAEQVLEFLAPSNVAGKVTKAVGAARSLSKLPSAIKGGINLGTRVLSEGLGAAGLTSAQEGQVNNRSLQSGLVSASAPILGKTIGNLANKLGNFAFSTTIPSTITQRGKDLVKGLDLGEAVSNTGVSLTRKALIEKVERQISGLGSRLGKAIDDSLTLKPNVTYSIGDIAGQVKKALSNKQALDALKASPIDLPKAVQAIDDTLAAYKELYKGKALNNKDIQAIKVALGNGLETVFQKALDAPLKAKALTEINLRSNLRKIIEKNVPQAEGINKQLAPLFEASGRLGKKGPYSGFLTDLIAGSMTAGNVGDLLGDPAGYLKRFGSGVLLKRLGTSTAAKTLGGTILKDSAKIMGSAEFLQLIRRALETYQKPDKTK